MSPGSTRRGLLGGAVLVAVGTPAAVIAQNGADTDKRVLQLLLALEHAESALYEAALRGGGLSGELEGFAEVALEHERAHLEVVKDALGPAAGPAPGADFGRATTDADAFARTAARLEDLAVAAYNAQAAAVSRDVFLVAARIVSVEARHAAWIRSIVGEDPAPQATDKPLSERGVRQGLRDLGVTL